MPLAFRDLEREVKAQGYLVEMTKQGHYWVLTPSGGKLIVFSVSHKKNSRGEVFDPYVRNVRKAIRKDLGLEE
jgi:hypothetical protein